jgi:hypothetical protein
MRPVLLLMLVISVLVSSQSTVQQAKVAEEQTEQLETEFELRGWVAPVQRSRATRQPLLSHSLVHTKARLSAAIPLLLVSGKAPKIYLKLRVLRH